MTKPHTAIVGAGINGLLCAYMLARQGHRVEVFEKGPLPNPSAASHGTHRLIHPWSANGARSKARDAHDALMLWKTVLSQIGSDGFEATGIMVVDDRCGLDFGALGIESDAVSGADLGGLLPFLGQKPSETGRLFPQFGVLFADQILRDLLAALRARGVTLHAQTPVSAIDPRSGDLCLADGERKTVDHIVLAAGTGAGPLLPPGCAFDHPEAFTSRRCFVAYVDMPEAESWGGGPAWANLGADDMWGMPAVRGVAMKLGNGVFTRRADSDETENADEAGRKILESYAARYPIFRSARLERSAYNHWTWIGEPKAFKMCDRLVVVTSDDGGGFKFAPLVARKITAAIAGQDAGLPTF